MLAVPVVIKGETWSRPKTVGLGFRKWISLRMSASVARAVRFVFVDTLRREFQYFRTSHQLGAGLIFLRDRNTLEVKLRML